MLMRRTLAPVALLCIGFAGTAFAQRVYTNDGTKPVKVMIVEGQLSGTGGYWKGFLYVENGESLVVYSDDPIGFKVAGGAGFVVRDNDAGARVIDVTTALGTDLMLDKERVVCSLHLTYVEWDHDGNLTTLEGISPFLFIENSSTGKTKNIGITSGIYPTKIKNGNVYFTLAGHGGSKYWLKIKFGRIIALGQVGDRGEKASEVKQHEPAAPSSGITAKATGRHDTQSPRKVIISPGVAIGLLLERTPPVYPPIARQARVSGTVVVRVTISETGAVEDLSVDSGPAMLQQAALDAVKTYRYRPYLLNDKPVKAVTTVNVIFPLGG